MEKEYLLELINNNECERIEYKENWFDREELGQYISAISNSAAEAGEEYGYFIWGINDKTHEIVGTSFEYDIDIKNEPLKHYLARLLNPSISFLFETFNVDGKKVVCLTIPAAKRIMTEFDKNRFIRIGSSKELLRKFPEREIDLAVTLKNGYPTIVNTISKDQNLKFSELKAYYIAKGAYINPNSFEDNLGLFVPGTKKYNELAYILSDNNDITCRVSVFSGKRKSDNQYSLNDFGRKCILLSVDQILYFLDSFNINVMDETNRVVERKDIPLFDSKCLREAILNAFIHNDWVDLNNLVDNAIKYNKENGRIDVTAQTDLDGRTVLTIADTGIGIPQDQLDRIFERFYRVDKSHSREIGGTGLGLSIVKHAAIVHGAEVEVESTLGEGTAFKISFPSVKN